MSTVDEMRKLADQKRADAERARHCARALSAQVDKARFRQVAAELEREAADLERQVDARTVDASTDPG